MKSVKILGWKVFLLAIASGILLVALLKIYPMLAYYFPESQRGIYKGTEEKRLCLIAERLTSLSKFVFLMMNVRSGSDMIMRVIIVQSVKVKMLRCVGLDLN